MGDPMPGYLERMGVTEADEPAPTPNRDHFRCDSVAIEVEGLRIGIQTHDDNDADVVAEAVLQAIREGRCAIVNHTWTARYA